MNIKNPDYETSEDKIFKRKTVQDLAWGNQECIQETMFQYIFFGETALFRNK